MSLISFLWTSFHYFFSFYVESLEGISFPDANELSFTNNLSLSLAAMIFSLQFFTKIKVISLEGINFIIAFSFLTLQIKEFRFLSFLLNEFSLFFFLTGLHSFHVLVGCLSLFFSESLAKVINEWRGVRGNFPICFTENLYSRSVNLFLSVLIL